MQRYPRAYEGQGRFWHDYRDSDIVACPSELGWLLPLATTFLYALSRGMTVVLYDAMGRPFSARQWFRMFEKYRISNFTATPTAYRLLLSEGDLSKRFDLSAWRHGVSCGEPLPADTLARARESFRVTLLDGLGTTECPVYCCNELERPIRPGSCGKSSAGVTVAVMDENLQPVHDETDGIMCVRRDCHPGIMRGYWNKPERTAEVFRDAWYFTRDLVCRDQDGYHWFRSRADDMIKSGGYLISPLEIEQCVCSHPAVAEAAAIAWGDPLRGNRVKAFVVLRGELAAAPGLDDEIRNFVRERLAPYKCPREIEFVASLPRTTSGKIRRIELRNR
jgi:acetyl-CoA synthetase